MAIPMIANFKDHSVPLLESKDQKSAVQITITSREEGPKEGGRSKKGDEEKVRERVRGSQKRKKKTKETQAKLEDFEELELKVIEIKWLETFELAQKILDEKKKKEKQRETKRQEESKKGKKDAKKWRKERQGQENPDLAMNLDLSSDDEQKKDLFPTGRLKLVEMRDTAPKGFADRRKEGLQVQEGKNYSALVIASK